MQSKYAAYALDIAKRRLSSIDSRLRRDACSGTERLSKKALLSMLGEKKQPKQPVVSVADQEYASTADLFEKNNKDLDATASMLGLKKSSLKRKLANTTSAYSAYNETSPDSISRKYLENNFASWTVSSFDAKTMEACLDMTNGSGTIRLSVAVPKQFTSRI
jgi:hypothetical protein